MRVSDSPFDSTHYDRRVAHLHADAGDGEDALEAALEEARARRVDVLFLRLEDRHSLRPIVERRGTAPVDVLVTSTLTNAILPSRSPAVALERHASLVRPADVAAVEAITAAAIVRSHLHADPRLPIDRTRRLYAQWARNDVTGRGQQVFVARVAGELVGYISVLVAEARAIIDLVAVQPSWHGHGIGSSLLAGFLEWVAGTQLTASVGTQADNPALRLYARCGFVPSATHFSYHLWLSESPP